MTHEALWRWQCFVQTRRLAALAPIAAVDIVLILLSWCCYGGVDGWLDS